MGTSITEFMAVGLPVVAMDVPVFHDVFPDQLDLLRQGDVSGAAARVVYWLEHPEAARARAHQGRDFIARYDQETVARREFEALAGAMPSG
jgi:glycosyltransferase involved in cell wall biosynthesis